MVVGVSGLVSPIMGAGNKAGVAPLVWRRFGVGETYIEPFVFTGNVAFQNPRPDALKLEVLNDINGFVANALRSLKYDFERVAWEADRNVTQLDFMAVERRLLREYAGMVELLDEDIDYFDAKVAGLWLYYLALSIDMGRRLHIGKMTKSMPSVNAVKGVGAGRMRVPYYNEVAGALRYRDGSRLREWFARCAMRLERSVILRKQWDTLFSPSILGQTKGRGGGKAMTLIFLDPPYDNASEKGAMYVEDEEGIAGRVMERAIELGRSPRNRVIVCGYEDDHETPVGWTKEIWREDGIRQGGKERQVYSRAEAIWCSPRCNKQDGGEQLSLV